MIAFFGLTRYNIFPQHYLKKNRNYLKLLLENCLSTDKPV